MKDRYEAGLRAAQKAIMRKLPFKKASSINALTKMAGMDDAEVYQCGAEEAQGEMLNRINMLIARRAKKLDPDIPHNKSASHIGS